jgi:hypothetical protein
MNITLESSRFALACIFAHALHTRSSHKRGGSANGWARGRGDREIESEGGREEEGIGIEKERE